MKLIDGKMVFDSGRAFDPTCGVVGLSVSGDDLEAFEGQDGIFMSREEALTVAIAAGQRIYRCGGDEKKLYSENLY